jgi:hypothetical protein
MILGTRAAKAAASENSRFRANIARFEPGASGSRGLGRDARLQAPFSETSGTVMDHPSRELPVQRILNIGPAAEFYFSPDGKRIIGIARREGGV